MEQPVDLTKISNISQNESDEVILFDDMFINQEFGKQTSVQTDPYSFLISSFRDMCNNLDGNYNFEDLVHIRSFLNDQTLKVKQKCFEEKKNLHLDQDLRKGPQGSLISSNIPNSKRKRTHGNRYV